MHGTPFLPSTLNPSVSSFTVADHAAPHSSQGKRSFRFGTPTIVLPLGRPTKWGTKKIEEATRYSPTLGRTHIHARRWRRGCMYPRFPRLIPPCYVVHATTALLLFFVSFHQSYLHQKQQKRPSAPTTTTKTLFAAAAAAEKHACAHTHVSSCDSIVFFCVLPFLYVLLTGTACGRCGRGQPHPPMDNHLCPSTAAETEGGMLMALVRPRKKNNLPTALSTLHPANRRHTSSKCFFL